MQHQKQPYCEEGNYRSLRTNLTIESTGNCAKNACDALKSKKTINKTRLSHNIPEHFKFNEIESAKSKMADEQEVELKGGHPPAGN